MTGNQMKMSLEQAKYITIQTNLTVQILFYTTYLASNLEVQFCELKLTQSRLKKEKEEKLNEYFCRCAILAGLVYLHHL
jgi:hypothetical protein